MARVPTTVEIGIHMTAVPTEDPIQRRKFSRDVLTPRYSLATRVWVAIRRVKTTTPSPPPVKASAIMMPMTPGLANARTVIPAARLVEPTSVRGLVPMLVTSLAATFDEITQPRVDGISKSPDSAVVKPRFHWKRIGR
jgi:hypothetical protein